MGRLRRGTGQTIWLLLFCVGWSGCSHPGNAHSSGHPVPFGEEAQHAASELGPNQSSVSIDHSSSRTTDIPFRDPESLSAGTLITVRLSEPVSSRIAGEPQSGTFEAVIDEPVVVEGITIVPSGASVSGRIESARPPEARRKGGLVRLTLDSVEIDGRSVTIQTSSLFARGRTESVQRTADATVVSIERGRRLTFRLSEPVYVVAQPIISSR